MRGGNKPARTVQPVDQQAERHEPGDAEDEVGGPVDEGAAEGEQPDDGEEDAERGHDVRVDEAAQVPGRHAPAEVQVVRRDAQDDGGEDQLRQAEDQGEDVGENHGRGFLVMVCFFVGMFVGGGESRGRYSGLRKRARLIILPGGDDADRKPGCLVKKVGRLSDGRVGRLWVFIREMRVLGGSHAKVPAWFRLAIYDSART